MGRVKLLQKSWTVVVSLVFMGVLTVGIGNTSAQVISENFNGTFPPAGWTVAQDLGPVVWHRSDTSPNNGVVGGLPSPMSGYAAYAESFPAYCGNSYDTSLISPPFSTEGMTQVQLQFDYQYWVWDTEFLDVDYRIGGGSWINLESLLSIGGYSAQTHTIDISMVAGNPSVQIRFRYYNLGSGCDWWATIDNVLVDVPPPPTPVPTLGEWGLMILASFLGGISIQHIRKRSSVS